MQVGGKLDPGESARDAALREVEEELGAVLEDTDLEVLGDFEAVAANEPGTVVRSSVFVTRAPLPAPLRVRAELAARQWIPVADEVPPGGSVRASSSPVRACPRGCGCGPSSRTTSGSPSPTRSRRAGPAGWRR